MQTGWETQLAGNSNAVATAIDSLTSMVQGRADPKSLTESKGVLAGAEKLLAIIEPVQKSMLAAQAATART